MPCSLSLTVTAAQLANGYVKARTGDSTTDTVYAGWYTSVYMPAVTDPETSGTQQSSLQNFEEALTHPDQKDLERLSEILDELKLA